MKNLSTIGIVFLLGLVAGAAIALLNAPSSGEKTRKKLLEGLTETRTRTEDAIANVQSRAKETVGELQNRAQKIATDVGEKVQPATQKVKSVATK